MRKFITVSALALCVSVVPVAAQEVVEPIEGPLAEGGPTAQLGIGDNGITPETALHIGGLAFVAVATGVILASGGGDSDSPQPAAPSTPTSN